MEVNAPCMQEVTMTEENNHKSKVLVHETSGTETHQHCNTKHSYTIFPDSSLELLHYPDVKYVDRSIPMSCAIPSASSLAMLHLHAFRLQYCVGGSEEHDTSVCIYMCDHLT